MKQTDYQLIGYIGAILGAIFLVSGLFASTYCEYREGLINYIYVVYPYAPYSGSLVLAGIVLLVMGLAFLWRAKQEEREIAQPKIPY